MNAVQEHSAILGKIVFDRGIVVWVNVQGIGLFGVSLVENVFFVAQLSRIGPWIETLGV